MKLKITLILFLLCTSFYSTSQQVNIVNGEKANLKDFPWSIRLKVFYNGKWDWSCGGSIISKKFILTAAHCLEPINGEERKIKVYGSGNGAVEELIELGEIKANYIHPDYLYTKPGEVPVTINDIGIIEMSNDISFLETVRPVKLIKKQHSLNRILKPRFYTEDIGSVGWGATIAPEDDPDRVGDAKHLQYTYRNLVMPLRVSQYWNSKNNRDTYFPFNKIYKDFAWRSFDSGGFILIEGIRGASGCFGDSGSLLFKRYNSKNNVEYLGVGLVSHGAAVPWCKAGTVYTNIQVHLDWIDSIIN